MILDLEPGRVEGPIDGGPDLREERGRVRRREVGLQGRLLLPLLEEQKGAGVIGRAPEAVVDAARLVDSVPPHVLGRRDRGIALVRAYLSPAGNDDHLVSPSLSCAGLSVPASATIRRLVSNGKKALICGIGT